MDNWLFDKFVAVMQLACMPYEVQASYYEEFIYVPEGIVSAFYDDALIYIPQLINGGLLPGSIQEDIKTFETKLNNFVDEYGVDFELKYLNHPTWLELKEIATTILGKLNQKVEPPDSKYI